MTGVTGLVIAHGLQKAGIPYAIFDHEPNASSRPREWTMGLHWALPLLESLLPADLIPRLHETYVDPSLDWSQPPLDRMRMYNGLTGEIMKDILIKGKIVRVSRRKLRIFVAEGIDVKVYNHSLGGIQYNDDDTVTAIFADGSTETGSLIVGADGPRSAVRSLIFGEEEGAAKPLKNVIHTNITIHPGDKDKALFLRSTHPVVQDEPSTDPSTWSFQLVSGWRGSRSSFTTPSSRITELKRRGSLLCEPYKSAFECLEEDRDVRFEELSCWESKDWDSRNGRVVLAGDAAHAMPPREQHYTSNRGQGLNHAIQDAYNLVNILTVHHASLSAFPDLTERIQSYAHEVSIRGAEEVRLSMQNAYMVMDWKMLEQSPVFKHALDRSPTSYVKKNGDEDEETAKEAQKDVAALAGA
ncbi:FAD/NAD(P)-binding domain-containing protein [Aureobasidium subglaciale]|nr:FAD/NAD(P)-binding domain-containing protein [Aureobasidium subglaciale]